MSQLEFIIALVMMTTLCTVESVVPSTISRQDAIVLGPGDILGPSFPNNTEYVNIMASRYDIFLAVDIVAVVYGVDDCGPVAASKGAHFYTQSGSSDCYVVTLKYPLCSSHNKAPGPLESVYVKKCFISDGQDNDYAITNNLSWPMDLPHATIKQYEPVQMFRIQNPTILTLPEFFYPPQEISRTDTNFRVAILDNGNVTYLPTAILADPACHSNSTCAVPFVRFTDGPLPSSEILHDLCGDTVVISPGEELNLLSHARIGCEFFPDSYPEQECKVNFTGSGALKLNMTYVDFVGADACDGFHISIVAHDGCHSPKIDLCPSGIAEMNAPLGSGQIIVSGSSISGRDKYGFIINISYA